MLHYHGTPITPRNHLLKMAGRNFCVSFAAPRDAATCIRIGQSVMFDNGAFSAHTRGAALDVMGFYAWAEQFLAPPHWAVVPDVIDGTVEQQRVMRGTWPFARSLGAPVWHLGLPIDYLLELAGEWPRICFGSTAQFWQVGSDAWSRRCDEAFNALAQRHRHLPHVHMLRGLSLCGKRWPFASADSVNVARNYKRNGLCPDAMARRIDAVQCPVRWGDHYPPQENNMRVYLCGPINGRSDAECNDWRSEAKRLLAEAKVSTLDPMDRDYRGREGEPGIDKQIVENDLIDITASDALLVMFDKPSVGTSMEVRIAWQDGKPIHIVNANGKPLSPWMTYHATAVHPDIGSACAALTA